jgi:hypothetical protein
VNPQILAIVLSVALLLFILALLRSNVLPEKYAVVWLIAGVVSVFLSIFPAILNTVAAFFGISQPINLIFFAGFFLVLLFLMQLTLELARTRDELRRVVQSIAIDLEEKADRSAPDGQAPDA